MEHDIDTLTGSPLAYEFIKCAFPDEPVIGAHSGPFAVYSAETQQIVVFGGRETAVHFQALQTDGVNNILNSCKDMNPLIHFEVGRVRCILGSVTASAPTLQEAMMRAYIKACRAEDSAHPV